MKTSLTEDQIAAMLYRTDRAHTPLPNPDALDDSHIRKFHEDGFIAIENVYSADEIESAKQALSDIIASPLAERMSLDIEPAARDRKLDPHEREPFVRKLMWFTQHEPRLHAICFQPTLIRIVERLLAGQSKLIQDMALLKPPHIGREKPWHQDAAYFLYDPPTAVLGTWMALDAATADNGCMHVIPGSHHAGPVPHYHERDCQIRDDAIDIDRDVIVPVMSGGVMFFSALLHHGTPPNRSPQRRRALQFHFARVDSKKIDNETHATRFYDASGHAGCTVPPKSLNNT